MAAGTYARMARTHTRLTDHSRTRHLLVRLAGRLMNIWEFLANLGPAVAAPAPASAVSSRQFQGFITRASKAGISLRLAPLAPADESYRLLSRGWPLPSLHGWLHDGGLWVRTEIDYQMWQAGSGDARLIGEAWLLHVAREEQGVSSTLFVGRGIEAWAFTRLECEELWRWLRGDIERSSQVQICGRFDADGGAILVAAEAGDRDDERRQWWPSPTDSVPSTFTPLTRQQRLGRRDRNRLVIDEDALMLFVGAAGRFAPQAVRMLRALRVSRRLTASQYGDQLDLGNVKKIVSHMSTRVSQIRGPSGHVAQLEIDAAGELGVVFEAVTDTAFIDIVDGDIVLRRQGINEDPDRDTITFVNREPDDEAPHVAAGSDPWKRKLFESVRPCTFLYDAKAWPKGRTAAREIFENHGGDDERLARLLAWAFILVFEILEAGAANDAVMAIRLKTHLRRLLLTSPLDLPWRKEFEACL